MTQLSVKILKCAPIYGLGLSTCTVSQSPLVLFVKGALERAAPKFEEMYIYPDAVLSTLNLVLISFPLYAMAHFQSHVGSEKRPETT